MYNRLFVIFYVI